MADGDLSSPTVRIGYFSVWVSRAFCSFALSMVTFTFRRDFLSFVHDVSLAPSIDSKNGQLDSRVWHQCIRP
jgi:hypothetical protein